MANRNREALCCQTNRRTFLKATTTASAAALAGGLPAVARAATAAAKPETLVQQLFATLTAPQKQLCAFPFDHPLRSEVDNNWHITKTQLSRDFTADQQALIRDIFRGLHSEEYADRVQQQVEHDGGFGRSSIALFGEPGSGKFEFVLTGRHVTRRCDGDSVAGAAFGGPIFYGHAAQGFNEPADHAGNVYWYQAQRANELFQALDEKQRQAALLDDSRGEHGTATVQLQGPGGKFAGLPVSELTADQRRLAEQVLSDLLAPFREVDREESMKLIRADGLERLHFSYYKNEDLGNDGTWDVWQIEGPHLVWYFRGNPHVHTWVHIRGKDAQST